jgi:predicted transcriptional regulator
MGFDLALEIGDEKAASYARLGTMIYKVAMLLAAVDTFRKPIRVEARHAYAAQLICERWRESLHRLDTHLAQAKYNGLDEKILNFIKPSGEVGVTVRDVLRGCNVDTDKVQNTLKMLADSGVIEMFQHKPEGRGRPSIRYKAVVL